MYYFATYFDVNYLPRALALYRSLCRRCSEFRLFALCMDASSLENLRAVGYPEIIPIPLSELEGANPTLAKAKAERSRIEYYFTCGPAFLLHVFDNHAEVDLLSFIDADLFFFSNPAPVYREMEGYSIGIVEHRFSRRYESRKKFGIYNVGWSTFRRDDHALQCLRWWNERCIDWCYDRVEPTRYADQKYLDQWPALFQGVRVIQHKGVNVAPWNVINYSFVERDGHVWVDDQPLICFHFHGCRQLLPWLFDSNLGRNGGWPSRVLRQKVFGPYIAELKRSDGDGHITSSIRGQQLSLARYALDWCVRIGSMLWRQAYIIVYRGQVL